MKNILLLTLVILSNTVCAQQDNNSYKPTKGDWAVELGSSLNFKDGSVFILNDGPINNMIQSMSDSGNTSNFPTLKVRRFIKPNVAERYLLNLSIDKIKYGTNSSTETGVSIGYGRERHFKGTHKLSTYVGWDFSLGLGSVKQGKETLGGVVGGLKLFSGADYYIAHKIYLGAELGMSVNGYSYGSNPSFSEVKMSVSAFPILRIGYIL
jgi:hypothetical protein